MKPTLPKEGRERLAFHVVAEAVLAKVAAVLAQEGIPAVPVKGIALARWLYDEPLDRPMGDIDLLVAPEHMARAYRAVKSAGYEIFFHARTLGELTFYVDEILVELHADVGHRDFSGIRVHDVLARSVEDRTTFRCAVLRIDDVDHLLLVAANIAKDQFTGVEAHQTEDMARLLARVRGREADAVERARKAGFCTGLSAALGWFWTKHTALSLAPAITASARQGAKAMDALLDPPPRWLYAALVRSFMNRPRPNARLGHALLWCTNDRITLRVRSLVRAAWWSASLRLGRATR